MSSEKPKTGYPNEDLLLVRGKILDIMSSIEMGVAIYISRYFFKSENLDFIHTVLYDKYVPFIAQMSIFKKILKREGIKFPFKKLERLVKIRNKFTHAWKSSPNPSMEIFNLIGQEDMNDILDVNSLFNEYLDKYDEVQKELQKLIGS